MVEQPLGTVTTAGYCALTGATFCPVLQYFGVDPSSLVWGFMGCIMAQLIFRPRNMPPRAVAALTMGSVVLAGSLNPLVSPILQKWWEAQGNMTEIRFFSAVLIGAFSKPLLLFVRDKMGPFLFTRSLAILNAIFGKGKEE